MMRTRSILRLPLHLSACLLVAAGLLSACSREPDTAAPPQQALAPDTASSFIGRSWVVIASTAVASGTVYRFEQDGRLIITSPGSLTATGEWKLKSGELYWIEESQTYRVEILSQTADAFQVRVHSPGEPLDISMKPLDTLRAAP